MAPIAVAIQTLMKSCRGPMTSNIKYAIITHVKAASILSDRSATKDGNVKE